MYFCTQDMDEGIESEVYSVSSNQDVVQRPNNTFCACHDVKVSLKNCLFFLAG